MGVESVAPDSPPHVSEELFQRVGDLETERFEDELLLMHNETRQTITLNPPAAALWEALRWPLSREEVASLLLEARPDEDEGNVRFHVDQLLDTLKSAGFIVSFARGG